MDEPKPSQVAKKSADDYDYPQEMDGEKWVEYFWNKDILPWVSDNNPDTLLLKYFEERGCQGKKGLKVFFPMCSISPDMKWVAEQGHSVTGCEFAPQAGPLFARNMKLSFSESPDPARHGKIFHYKELSVNIYCCDIYDFMGSINEQYDIIWDCGAFCAANQKDKQRYADLLKPCLKPDGKLFLGAIDYPEGAMRGPPFPVKDEHVRQFFPEMDCELIESMRLDDQDADYSCPHPWLLRLLTFKSGQS